MSSRGSSMRRLAARSKAAFEMPDRLQTLWRVVPGIEWWSTSTAGPDPGHPDRATFQLPQRFLGRASQIYHSIEVCVQVLVAIIAGRLPLGRTVHASLPGLDVRRFPYPSSARSAASRLPRTARDRAKGVHRRAERFQANGDHAGGQATGGQHAGQPGQELSRNRRASSVSSAASRNWRM